MAESNDTNNENNETTQTIQVSAGTPQRVSASERGPAAAPAPTPTAAEFDARQQAKGILRKSGPPLPDITGRAALAVEAATEQEEPTEVTEPRK